MVCEYCGETRFNNAAQQSCHVNKNHAEFACTCNKRFKKERDLTEHNAKMAENAKVNQCPCCCRSFETLAALHQHQRMKGHWLPGEREKAQKETGRYFCHDRCGRSFGTDRGLLDHRAYFGPRDDKYECYDCLKIFADPSRLSHHQRDTKHRNKSSPKDRNQRVKAFYDHKVKVDSAEKKNAVCIVTDCMRSILSHIRRQPDGKMYSGDICSAGSHAAKTKIGKPDEFDTNIPIATKGTKEVTRGQTDYAYKPITDSGQGVPGRNNMNVPREMVELPENARKEIPMGHAVIKAGDSKNIPDHLKYRGDLVPREIKRDLYERCKTSIDELGLGAMVHLSRDAHGPAITITIKQPGGHDISVDIVPTHPSAVPVSVYGWPRPDTRRAFTEDQTRMVRDAGLHLVPKGDTTWYISFSKAERAMFSVLDRDNGCRKDVLKCIKKMVMDVKSRSPDGLPGVTSHLGKNLVLWSCEKNPDPGLWRKENLAERLIHTIADLEDALTTGKLPNYFNTSENLLKGKDKPVLRRLANELNTERNKLMHM